MTHWSRFATSPSPRIFETLRSSDYKHYLRQFFNLLNFYVAVVLSLLAIAISTQSVVAADGANCTAGECNYSVPLDKPGFYTVTVTLPAGQKAGVYNLLIDPSTPYEQAPIVNLANGFHGGGLLKEGGQSSSWVGFSLAQFEPVNISVYNHSNPTVPLDLILTNSSRSDQTLLKFGPILTAHGQVYTTPILEPGFYVASVSGQPSLPLTAYSISVGGSSVFGGVSGGWLDSNNVGWGGFYATQPRTVNLRVQFGSVFGVVGVDSPNVQLYYLKSDGTRELKWSTIEQNTEWDLVEPTVSLVLPEPTVLPPDPGEPGKISLEGIDSDKDGIRDDIQRYIALTYPNPEDKPFRSALREYSASQQVFLLEAGDKWKTVANAQNRAKQIDCILYIRPTDGQASLVNLRAEYLNTESRTRSYLNADDQLGGQSISLTPYEELPQSCQKFVTNESALSNRSSARSDSCKKDTSTVISLSNDGMTDAESAQRELTTLRTQVENAKKTSAFSGEKMSFVVSYTRGWIPPLFSLAKSKLVEESPNNTSIFWHWLGNTKPLPYELMNIAQNLANNPFIVAENDLESQVSTYRTFIDEGRKVVAIGHSEGNFYANQAYENMDVATTLRARKDSFGIVSVAPPVMTGNCARVEVGSVVAVAGEGCTTLATDTVSSAGALVDILNNVTRPLPGFIVDPLGHSLDSYLNGDVSGPKIVNDVFSTISKLTPAPIVSQGAITVRLEWGQQPDVDLHVYEPNGAHVYFADKQGTSGYLDRDDLDKEGPEHYYSKCDTLQTGLYKVAVNYYSGAGAETARINISAGETTRSYTVPLATAVGQNGNGNPIPVAVVKVSRDKQSGEFKFDILSQQVAEKKADSASTLGICAGGDFHDETSSNSCIDGNCSSTGVKIVCTSESCQWCDIHNTCGNIKYNDTTQITGGSISCRNGNCNYSLRSGGSSSSGNFYCKGTSSTPSSVTTPSAVPLVITQITDPAVPLGMLFTDDQQKETLGSVVK